MLEVREVTRTYERRGRRVDAVRGISLAVERGEMLVLLGPSGSGKSTLLHLMGGLDRPTSGSVLFHGTDLATLADAELARLRRDRIVHVFQFFNLLPTLTAAENAALPLLLASVGAKEARRRAHEALERVGLADRAEHHAEQLSGGEQQRVAIARALTVRPEVLLADEPTGNLDSATGREVLAVLREMAGDDGRTVVMVTHDEEAAKSGDRRVRIRDGRVESVA